MKKIWVITLRELKSYFASPIAYGLIAIYAFLFGFFFVQATTYFLNRGVEAQMMGRSMPMDVNEWVIRPVITNLSVIGLFLIPMITMRLFAEEKRSGTIELLLTSPVTDIDIIVGKWLAALMLYSCILAASAVDIGILFFFGQPDWRPILIAYLGMLLQGGSLLAIGTAISAMTRTPIIAAGGGFAVCLLLWVLDWLNFDPSSASKVLAYLSVVSHFESFAKGVLDTKDIVFYISMIFFGLFLTARVLESVRWRA